MNILDLIFSALQSLRANIMRTALTALGMIIGVSAVIVMIAIGSGAQAGIQSVIESIGANMIIVTPASSRNRGVQQGAGTRQSLTWSDANAIMEEIPSVKIAAPSVRTNMQVIFENNNWRSSIEGVTNGYFEARGWSINEGRFFEEDEVNRGAKIVVIGETIRKNLFSRFENFPINLL